ncbi:MAG: polymer-forming cytoskeletal protein, partial [Firmicutes bacterium]|nr:polymer-forming cytoskeletal protein [Bacillota bacterium]
MKKKNRVGSILLAMLLLLSLMVSTAFAVEIRSGDMVNVSSGNVKGPLFVSGNNVTVDADVDGDVFAAGQSITINGQVKGDIIAAGNSVSVNGSVLGDVRTVGNTIDVNGTVDGNVTAAGNSLSISKGAIIKRDALLMGNTIYVSGPIGGQVLGNGSQIQLNAPINGEVRIWDVQTLVIGPLAIIGGMLTYGSNNQAQIAPDAKIGAISRVNPPVKPQKSAAPMPKTGFSWGAVLWSWLAGLVIWGAAHLLMPRILPKLGETVQETPWPTLGWGLLTLLVAPMAILLLMITVIGIPLAFILIF